MSATILEFSTSTHSEQCDCGSGHVCTPCNQRGMYYGEKLIKPKKTNEERALLRQRMRDAKHFGYEVRSAVGYTPNLTGNYVKRDNAYVSGRFQFNLNDCKAWSYSWWLFVKRVGNTIYFNDARYSMQTATHQEMAKNIILMADPKAHGLKIKYVYVREGLNHIDRAISNVEFNISEIKIAMANPRSRKSTNKDRAKTIKRLEKIIKELKQLKKEIRE